MNEDHMFFESEDGTTSTKLYNIPGNAINLACRDGSIIEIDPSCLDKDKNYFLFANSTMYILERIGDYIRVHQATESGIEKYEKGTGKKIPRSSTHYRLTQK